MKVTIETDDATVSIGKPEDNDLPFIISEAMLAISRHVPDDPYSALVDGFLRYASIDREEDSHFSQIEEELRSSVEVAFCVYREKHDAKLKYLRNAIENMSNCP